MNQSPESQFKKFLIIIAVVVTVIIYAIIKPDFFSNLKQSGVLKLSSQKPWIEEFDEEEELDDVDIELSFPENEFKKEDSNNPFNLDFNRQDEDEFWVTGSIPVNPMSDLNNKTKTEIYVQRKLFVENTIFKNRNYKPSVEVFSQIADKKPWLGIEALTCYGKGPNAYKGLSEESRYINNPTVLVGLDRVSFDEKPRKQCSPVDYLMPVKINYSKDENTIKVIFEVSAYKGSLGSDFLLKGLNARDLGFKYAYADNINNIAFIQDKNNVSTNVYAFQDFIHLGTACGVKGGCNNGSPNQKELHYTVMKYPASIHLKLWKKIPKNTDAKADINYLIIMR